jgi:nicotinamide mononucleotide transporter
MLDTLLAPLTPWPSLPWLTMSPLEIAATVFGLWSVIAYVRESVWAWPAGLINVLLYIVLFWQVGLYADSGLQVVYVGLQLYGWWCWLHGGAARSRLHITRTRTREWLVMALIALAAFVPMGLFLDRWTDSTVPWWDAAPTVTSLVAQWMISRKKLENWWVWIATDIIFIPLYAYKGLWLTAGLYSVFLVLCVLGLISWHRSLRRAIAAEAAHA